MTRRMDDTWDAAFAESQDGERLREAFAEHLERPGLEGPSYDAVLRSGTARRRRRRATFGATFAAAGVTGVATAVLATGIGATQEAYTPGTATTTAADPAARAATTTAGAPLVEVGTTLAARGSVPGATSTASTASTSSPASVANTTVAAAADTSSHPADAVLTSGTIDGHAWQLVRRYAQNSMLNLPGAPAPGSQPQWCGELDIVVDGVTTNSGNGNTPCLAPGPKAVPTPDPAYPGFTAIVILDARHERLGAVAAGSVSPAIASVTAQCGTKSSTVTTSQPSGDVAAYYSFTFSNGSGCPSGTLSFFNASGSRTALISDAALGGGK